MLGSSLEHVAHVPEPTGTSSERKAEDLGPQAARATHGPSAAMGTALAQRPA